EPGYVYLSHGSIAGVAVGDVYQVVRPTKKLENPKGGTPGNHDLGMHYLDVAQVRVVLVQPGFSLAHVLHNCADAVDVGDLLMPFNRIVVPAPDRPRPFGPTITTDSNIRGTVVSTKTVLLNFGSAFKGSGKVAGTHTSRFGSAERGIAPAGDIVYINIGQDRAVKPGDLFIVYRGVELYKRLYHYPHDADDILRDAKEAIGELVGVK